MMNILMMFVWGILGVLTCGYVYNDQNYVLPRNEFECVKVELMGNEPTCVQYSRLKVSDDRR